MIYTIRILLGAFGTWLSDPDTKINRFLGPLLSPRRYKG